MLKEFANWAASIISGVPREPSSAFEKTNGRKSIVAIPPGRVSVPNDTNTIHSALKAEMDVVSPSFRTELIPLIRKLYKVNPDVGIAVQDMFKLSNTKHIIRFPYNTEEEAIEMRKHLKEVSKDWSQYTAGIFGIVNKMFVQMLISGAISVEAVPKKDLSGILTLVFVNPEDIVFKRDSNGVYKPYQINKTWASKKEHLIELNTNTYFYLGMYNDTDEPFGIPPFLTALDSLNTQAEMKINIKHVMELLGMMGFFEAKMQKPDMLPQESVKQYEARLNRLLRELKVNIKEGLKDGTVTGFIDDHEFKLNSTTKDMGNLDKPWNMNQQSVANGLGVSGSIIGVSNDNKTEGGTSIMFSKLISQLSNLQEFGKFILQKIYSLELKLAGYNNKGIEVEFFTSTVNDEMKIQQGKEYKLRNLTTLYNQGIIGQNEFAFEMGYDSPNQKEPRLVEEETSSPNDPAQKEKREKDKDTSDRKGREKKKEVPKRKDGNPKE